MKKLLVATAIIMSFNATAMNDESISIDYSRGDIDAFNTDLGTAQTLGGSYQTLNGNGEWGFSTGFSFGQVMLDDIPSDDLDMGFVMMKVGTTYGLTDNIYLNPHVGVTYGVIESSNYDIDDSELGYNYGLDVLYHFQPSNETNGYIIGLGVTQHTVEDVEALQMNFKIGVTF